jgi:hypothetical protein
MFKWKPTLKFVQVNIFLVHFLFRMVWKKGMLYHHWFLTFLYSVPSGRSKKTKRDWNWMEHISFWSVLMIYSLHIYIANGNTEDSGLHVASTAWIYSALSFCEWNFDLLPSSPNIWTCHIFRLFITYRYAYWIRPEVWWRDMNTHTSYCLRLFIDQFPYQHLTELLCFLFGFA